jgi:ATP-dependent helicase/nuclease subunit A
MSGQSTAPVRQVPELTRALQASASDPGASAWVSANAGSGKTTVLVRRVLRLLLADVDPARILCLTYTKAAAANMQSRLFGMLADWVRLGQAELSQALALVLDRAPGAAELARARQLFVRALETPGGLKFETIHGFCTRVLQATPFEARIPARFEVITDTDKAAAIDDAICAVLALASADAGSLKVSLDQLASLVDDSGFRGLVVKAIASARFLVDTDGEVRPLHAIEADLRDALHVDPRWREEELAASALASVERLADMALAMRAVAAHGTETDISKWEPAAQAYPVAGPSARLDLWCDLLLTKDDQPRKGEMVTRKVVAAAPDLAAALKAASMICAEVRSRLRALRTYHRSLALFEVSRLVLARYNAAKRHDARLDYGDLIQRTRELFMRIEAAWVIYRLDSGLDHLLVDEAQDTSADQWAILNALTAEFLAGEGQRSSEIARTIFAVGDEKQSIFGFQGAAPAEFGLQRAALGERSRPLSRPFHDVRLNVSFRSTRDVIEAVDAVFAQPAAALGVDDGGGEGRMVHETVRGDASGAVDLWDLVEPPAKDIEVVWNRPVDAPERQASVQQLARTIARTARSWLDAGVDDLGRPVSAGDILVLLPKRKAAFAAIVRALKDESVPVAGMDRIELAGHIATQDLVALGRVALLPDDDLTFAVMLKGPIFGYDDRDLLRLAPRRAGSLRAALAASSLEQDMAAHARFGRIEALAASAGPFAFYSAVLSLLDGRRLMLSRLGAEAADVIDAFLGRAREHEQREGPSLSRFLDAVEASLDDVRRDLATARGEVRVMTVHSAKGLEAKVVIVADIGAAPSSRASEPFLDIPLRNPAAAGAGPACATVWSPRKGEDAAPAAAARAQRDAGQRAEFLRLLYVAMTRAEDRLIVCGIRPANGKLPAGSWYGLIESGLSATPTGLADAPHAARGVAVRRFKLTPEVGPRSAVPPAAARLAQPPDLPGWVHAPLPDEVEAAPPLAPANALSAASLEARPADQAAQGSLLAAAAARGRAVHKLLQWLPQSVPEARHAVGLRLLGQGISPSGASGHDDLVAQVCGLIEAPDLAALFGAGSLAEVAIAGSIETGRGRRDVSGRIDRLVVTATEIILGDFKTTLRPPETAWQIGAGTLAQLAAYRQLLRQLYPDRPVRTWVIYTAGPRVLAPHDAQLDQALADGLGVKVTEP